MIPRQSIYGSTIMMFSDMKKSPYIGTKFSRSYPIINSCNILPRENGYLGYFRHGNLDNSKYQINNKKIEVMNEYFNPELLLKVGKELKKDISSSDIKKNPYIGHKVYSDIHLKKKNNINKTNPHIGYTKRELPKKVIYDKKVFLEIGKMLSQQK